MKRYHSCYIIDISFEKDDVVLTDSTHMRWHISPKHPQLEEYMRHVFLPGVPQTLTVFEYEDRGSGVDIENHIVKMFNVGEKPV